MTHFQKSTKLYRKVKKIIVIKEKRNGGKTANLVARLEKNPKALLLVFNSSEAYRLKRSFFPKENFRVGVHTRRVMTWDYYFEHPEFYGRPLLIDNVDIYLRDRFKSNDIGVSINED